MFSAGRKPDRLFLRFDKLTKTALGETFAKGQLTLGADGADNEPEPPSGVHRMLICQAGNEGLRWGHVG